MAFPTTSLLDTFTRADETPIAGNWEDAMPLGSALPGLRLLSNRLAPPASGTGASEWKLTTFGPACEVYATVTAKSGVNASVDGYLFARKALAQGPDANFDDYIICLQEFTAATDNLLLVRDDNGADNIIGTFAQEVTAGDSYGLCCIDRSIQAWYKAAAGSWTKLGEVTDATYSAAGYVGAVMVAGAFRFDDFGGGTVPSPGDDPPIGLIGRGAGW